MILAIYGAGGGGREFIEVAKAINNHESRWESIIFVDDFSEMKELRGCPIYTFDELLKLYSPSEIEFTLAVGQPKDRKSLYEKVTAHGYHMATLIHPSAIIYEGTTIGDGCVIGINTIISCDTVIEQNVLILPCITIGNNCHISKNCVLSPHSAICASVNIGEDTYFGVHTCVRESTNVGKNVVVSAGSAVLKDLPDGVIAQGNPARAVLINKTGEIYKRE